MFAQLTHSLYLLGALLPCQHLQPLLVLYKTSPWTNIKQSTAKVFPISAIGGMVLLQNKTILGPFSVFNLLND